MNQFKNAWEFAFANWKYFLALGLPIIAIESLVGFLVAPLGDMTQPTDFIANVSSNYIGPTAAPFNVLFTDNTVSSDTL